MAYLIVGTAPAIRWVFVTFLSASRGTLKSTWCSYYLVSYGSQAQPIIWRKLLTLIRTRFPERSTSVIESLLERDMTAIGDLQVCSKVFLQECEGFCSG